MNKACLPISYTHTHTQDRDIEEGADIIMVKPGMPYLDIVRDTKERVSYKSVVHKVRVRACNSSW